MMKAVKWFHMEEEFCIGLVIMDDGKEIFITEEAVRFDAPSLTICDSLREAVGCKWFSGEDHFDNLREEDQKCFLQELKDITAEYKSAKDQILLHKFMRQMDELFSQYAKDDCLDGYRMEGNNIYIDADGEHCDSSYMWPALDGALYLYNKTYGTSIWVEEYAPEDGIIRYEFGSSHDED